MPDITISFKIPSAKVDKASQGFLKMYPNNETKDDPAFVQTNPPTYPIPQVAKYTDKLWVQEQIKRLVLRDINRGLLVIAREAIDNTIDESLII